MGVAGPFATFTGLMDTCMGSQEDMTISLTDRSNSSSAGSPVSSKAGRTLATMPKSTSQISPLLTPGSFLLHAVEHHRSLG